MPRAPLHPRKPSRRPHLTAVELAELGRRLESERLRLAALYLDDVRSERAIAFDEVEDELDRAEKWKTREEVSALVETEREQLRLVDEALERMRDGSYGYCLESGKPIPLARLRAVPWARYRSEVQARIEERELDRRAGEATPA